MNTYYGGAVDTPFGEVQERGKESRQLFAHLPTKHPLNPNDVPKPPKLDFLSKDLKSAEWELKVDRLMYPAASVWTFQIGLQLLFSLVFPQNYWTYDETLNFGPLNYIANVCSTFFWSVVSLKFFVVTCPLMLIVIFMARTISGPRKVEYAAVRNKGWKIQPAVLNPLALGLLIGLYSFLFMNFNDSAYSMFGSIHPTQKTDSPVLWEQILVIQLILFFAAVEFFADHLENGAFTMEVPSVYEIQWAWSSMVPLKEAAKKSLKLGLVVWISYLFFLRPIYFSIFMTIKQSSEYYYNLVFYLILNGGFLLRMFVYSLMTRISLRLFLKITNEYISKQTLNLPLEVKQYIPEPLSLLEAMKGDNSFIKHQAFFQYYSKGDVVDWDTLKIFKLSHPGNHATNWKELLLTCCDVLISMDGKITEFFTSAKLPVNMPRIRQIFSNQNRASMPMHPKFSAAMQPPQGSLHSMMRDLGTMKPQNNSLIGHGVFDKIVAEAGKLWDELTNLPFTLLGLLIRMFKSTPDTVPYPLANAKVRDEVHISNLLYDHMLSYWAMVGTMKLFCCSAHGEAVDPQNVVFRDVDFFLSVVVDVYEAFIYMESYLDRMLELWPIANKELLEQHKKVATKMTHTSANVLMEMNQKFSKFYDIIDVPVHRHSRICDILKTYETG